MNDHRMQKYIGNGICYIILWEQVNILLLFSVKLGVFSSLFDLPALQPSFRLFKSISHSASQPILRRVFSYLSSMWFFSIFLKFNTLMSFISFCKLVYDEIYSASHPQITFLNEIFSRLPEFNRWTTKTNC